MITIDLLGKNKLSFLFLLLKTIDTSWTEMLARKTAIEPFVAYRINRHMLDLDSYDPRGADKFPYDLRSDRRKKFTDVEKRRLSGGISNDYHGLWKVRKDVSLRFREDG